MSDRDPQHNYIVELIGVVEFNIPRSLNWLQQNISSDCEWQIGYRILNILCKKITIYTIMKLTMDHLIIINY
jgi:hypothetical protein